MKDRVFKEFCHIVETKSACMSGKNLSFSESNKYPPLANVLTGDGSQRKITDLSVCNKIFEIISIFCFLVFNSVERPGPTDERL